MPDCALFLLPHPVSQSPAAMKKLFYLILANFLAFTSFPVFAGTASSAKPATEAKVGGTEHLNALISRIEEIRQMDFSSLDDGQRADLRQELQSIHKAVKAEKAAGAQVVSGGVYISFGALIIIILLLILIL